MLEVLPGLEPRWIEVYGEVVMSGQPVLFQDYSAELGRYFEVWAYRPSQGKFATIIQDVTERHEKDSRIRQQDTRLSLALEATGAGLWDLEIATGRLEVDTRWAELLGYEGDEFTKASVIENRCHPEDLPRCLELRRQTIAGEIGRYECELRIRGRDGCWIWFLDSGLVEERGADGTPIRLVGTLVNIDRRKGAELATAELSSRLVCLLDSLDDQALFKDKKGRILGCNKAFERFLGRPFADISGKVVDDFFPPDFAASMRAQDLHVLATEETIRTEEWYRRADGSRVLIDLKKSPLRDADERVVGIAVIARDVTERHDAASATAIRLRILEFSHDHSGVELARFALEEVQRITESSLGLFFVIHEDMSRADLFAMSLAQSDAIAPSPTTIWISDSPALASCLREGRVVCYDGRGDPPKLAFPAGYPAFDHGILAPAMQGGRVAGILCVGGRSELYEARDLRLVGPIAEQVWKTAQERILEERLKESAQRRDIALDMTKAGLWTWLVQADRKEFDERSRKIVGQGRAGPLPVGTWDLLCHPEDREEHRRAVDRYLSGAAPYYESELRLRNNQSDWVWVLDRGVIVERDAEDRPLRMMGLMVDITGIKEAESALRETVCEKEALVHELFHRTKNSMQLINAMLELKKNELDSISASMAFNAIQDKIIAMSLVQEKIYQTGSFAMIDLGDYLFDLAQLLEKESPLGHSPHEFRFEIESVMVSVDTAIPCGIVVSELISNSFRHAFTSDAGGIITVGLGIDEEKNICLRVEDDGCGLPKGFDPRSDARLGLRTVIGIGEEQLRGSVRFTDHQPGVSVSISFRDLHFPKRL